MQKNQSTQYELLNSFAFKRKKNDKNNSFLVWLHMIRVG